MLAPFLIQQAEKANPNGRRHIWLDRSNLTENGLKGREENGRCAGRTRILPHAPLVEVGRTSSFL
jgi:hypothetical protein